MRFDGRANNQLRPYSVEYGIVQEKCARGSCRWSQGSETLVVVNGPCQPKYTRHERFDRLCLELECQILGSCDKNNEIKAIESFLSQELLKAIDIHAYPRLLLNLKVTVIGSDGSLYSNMFNSCIIALLDSGISMLSTPIATTLSSVKCIDGDIQTLLDPTDEEEKQSISILLFISNLDRKENIEMISSCMTIGNVDVQTYLDSTEIANNCSGKIRNFIRNLFVYE